MILMLLLYGVLVPVTPWRLKSLRPLPGLLASTPHITQPQKQGRTPFVGKNILSSYVRPIVEAAVSGIAIDTLPSPSVLARVPPMATGGLKSSIEAGSRIRRSASVLKYAVGFLYQWVRGNISFSYFHLLANCCYICSRLS